MCWISIRQCQARPTGRGGPGFTGHEDDSDGRSQVRDGTERTKVEDVTRDLLSQVLGHGQLSTTNTIFSICSKITISR